MEPQDLLGNPAVVADIGTPTADSMTWDQARSFLTEAGWSIAESPHGLDLVWPDGSTAGPLSDHRPKAHELVDGHGMLRGAGGGELDTRLAESVTETTNVGEVLVGLNWTMICVGDRMGIARSPERGTQGARTVLHGAPLAGRPLAELAGWLCSLDPLRRSIGLAAVNAYWNHPTDHNQTGQWGFAAYEPPGDGLIIVGGFRGAQQRLPNARILEREPQGNDIHVDDADEALATASHVAVTAQTLMNGSLEPLLSRVGGQSQVQLVGPSAPVCTQVLGGPITQVAGLAVTDRSAAASFIKETGTMIATAQMTVQLQLHT